MSEVRLVKIYTAADTIQAAMIKNMLEAAGINAFVEGDMMAANALQYGQLTAPTVWVPEPDAVHALEMIEHGEPDAAEQHDGTDGEPGVLLPLTEEEGNRPQTGSSGAATMVGRAMSAATFGVIFFPPLLHFYSLWLLLQVPTAPSGMDPATRRKLYVTFALDVVVIVVSLPLWWMLAR